MSSFALFLFTLMFSTFHGHTSIPHEKGKLLERRQDDETPQEVPPLLSPRFLATQQHIRRILEGAEQPQSPIDTSDLSKTPSKSLFPNPFPLNQWVGKFRIHPIAPRCAAFSNATYYRQSVEIEGVSYHLQITSYFSPFTSWNHVFSTASSLGVEEWISLESLSILGLESETSNQEIRLYRTNNPFIMASLLKLPS